MKKLEINKDKLTIHNLLNGKLYINTTKGVSIKYETSKKFSPISKARDNIVYRFFHQNIGKMDILKYGLKGFVNTISILEDNEFSKDTKIKLTQLFGTAAFKLGKDFERMGQKYSWYWIPGDFFCIRMAIDGDDIVYADHFPLFDTHYLSMEYCVRDVYEWFTENFVCKSSYKLPTEGARRYEEMTPWEDNRYNHYSYMVDSWKRSYTFRIEGDFLGIVMADFRTEEDGYRRNVYWTPDTEISTRKLVSIFADLYECEEDQVIEKWNMLMRGRSDLFIDINGVPEISLEDMSNDVLSDIVQQLKSIKIKTTITENTDILGYEGMTTLHDIVMRGIDAVRETNMHKDLARSLMSEIFDPENNENAQLAN